MIELRTLGALDLRGASGDEVRPILQQSKRLALLAYLAIAAPQRFHRRDTLLATFWPESDSEHARGALRRALYFLRRSLGDGVLVGRGDEEVGLESEQLWCDVPAFERALDEARLDDALELYRGPLLPGFYVTGAPEFERWLDVERLRLHDRACSAAWTLSERAERSGDARGAADWARRATALAPFDEPAHRRLIALLDRVGDRAAALRAYDDLAKRLRAEYELEPSAETRALVASLRTARALSREPEREAAPVPQSLSPTRVAVLPFVVRGSRDVAYLREGMVDLLATTLDGAGQLRTVDPRALLSFVAREETDDLDPQRARDIARQFDAGLVLLGSVVEAGGKLRVSAVLYDVANESAERETRVEVRGAGPTGIFHVVDTMSRQLIAARSTGPSLRYTRLAALTTESLPALKAYLRGESEFRGGRYFQALAEYQDATTEDATFALAHFRLAAAAAAVANLELARDASERATKHRGRLGARDRLMLDAQHAWLRGAADDAERMLTQVLATSPDDMEAWFLLGDVRFHHNPQRGRPFAESRDAFERALALDPDHVSSMLHLARIAAAERRTSDLDALVERVLASSPAGDRALSARALRAFTMGNQIEQARVASAMGGARALAVGIAFTDIVLYARELTAARRLARLMAKVVRSPEERALCHIVLAHLELARGRRAAAWRELRAVSQHDAAWGLELRGLFALMPFAQVQPDDRVPLRDELRAWDASRVREHRNQVLAAHNGVHDVLRAYLLGALAAIDRDERDAESQANALEHMAGSDSRGELASALARAVLAHAARAANRSGDALSLLEAPAPAIWYQLTLTSPFFSQALERFTRAELLLDAGRLDEAAAWFRTLGEGSPYEVVYLAPAFRGRAASAERAGKSRAAADYAARAAALWGGDEPGGR